MVDLKGMKGVKAANLYAQVVHYSRLNPFIVERGDYDSFFKQLMDGHIYLFDFEEEHFDLCLSFFKDSNDIPLNEKIESLTFDEIFDKVKEVLLSVHQMKIYKVDLWEGYPLEEAIAVLMKTNPHFNLENLVEMVQV